MTRRLIGRLSWPGLSNFHRMPMIADVPQLQWCQVEGCGCCQEVTFRDYQVFYSQKFQRRVYCLPCPRCGSPGLSGNSSLRYIDEKFSLLRLDSRSYEDFLQECLSRDSLWGKSMRALLNSGG